MLTTARRRSCLRIGLIATTLLAFGQAALAAWPQRPITLVVPWAAGGGTDATARIIAKLMEPELGVPVNVVNRTGGAGVVGHSAIATASPDGYTIGLITFEIGAMHWQGLTELSWKDYTPIALMNEDPAGVIVRADLPFRTAKELWTRSEQRPKASSRPPAPGRAAAGTSP